MEYLVDRSAFPSTLVSAALSTHFSFCCPLFLWFPMVAMTNYQKLHGLMQQKLISPQLWRAEAQSQFHSTASSC
jgi:hypothetical protein